MKPATLLGLLVVVLGLGAFVWFYERELPGSDERRELADRLWDFEPEDVDAIVVERGDERVRLERDPSGSDEVEEPAEVLTGGGPRWLLTEPMRDRADELAAGGVVDRLSTLEKERTLDDVDRVALGLEPPRARLTIEVDGQSHELALGASVPASETLVAEVDGEVVVVSDGIWSDIDRAPGDWRSRQAFPGDRQDLRRVSIEAESNRVLLASEGDGYRLESPLSDRAADDRTARLFGAIASLRIEEFRDDLAPDGDLAAVGLAAPRGAFEAVWGDRGERFRIEVGDPVSGDSSRRVVRVGDRFFETGDGIVEFLDTDVDAWRSKDWTSMNAFEVDRVEVEGPDGEWFLRREGTEWFRGEDRIDYSLATDLLYALEDAAADRLLDERQRRTATAGEPDWTIRLVVYPNEDSEEEKRSETLYLFRQRTAGYPARVDNRDIGLLLSSETAEDLLEKLEALRTAEPEIPDEEPVAAAE